MRARERHAPACKKAALARAALVALRAGRHSSAAQRRRKSACACARADPALAPPPLPPGVMGAKHTAALIPLCHNIPLSRVHVALALAPEAAAVDVRAEATTVGPTGVEMEALTAVAVAALTVYDMCKVGGGHPRRMLHSRPRGRGLPVLVEGGTHAAARARPLCLIEQQRAALPSSPGGLQGCGHNRPAPAGQERREERRVGGGRGRRRRRCGVSAAAIRWPYVSQPPGAGRDGAPANRRRRGGAGVRGRMVMHRV